MAEPGKFFELLTAAVANGARIKDAAAEIGCSQSHAYHLSASPTFKQRVAELRAEACNAAVGRLSDAASLAVDTLVEMLDAANEPAIRMQAAKAILANVKPLSEIAELRGRIDAIEKAASHQTIKRSA